MGQERQWSADGQWWWDGQKWIPRGEVQGPVAATPAPVSSAMPRVATVNRIPQTPGKGHGHGVRNALIAVGVLLVAGIGIGIAISGSTQSQSPTASTSNTQASAQTTGSAKPSASSLPVVAHTVLSVSGTGYETTQPFKIPSSEWTLSWTVTGDPKYAQATFEVYDSHGNHVDAVDASPGTDSATEHQGNDVFFIDVLVANATYKLTVTANYAGPDQIFAVPQMTTLTTVNGSGDKSSPTFHVTGSVWRIDVHTASVSQYTSVTAYVMSASDNSDVSEASVEGAQGGSDTTSYVYAGPGDYYIKVLSANTTWSVTVEQTSS